MRRWWFLVLFLIPSPVFAQNADRLAVLQFGIESEVLDLVKTLRAEKSKEYRDALADSYARAKTDDLKEQLLLYFLDFKDLGLEDRASAEIASPEKKGNSLLLNAVNYLTTLKSARAEETLVGLIDNKNKILAVAAIRGLGRLGATGRTERLIQLYEDAETDPNFKPDLVWAFGEMKSRDAVDLLLREYDDNEGEPLLRRTILEALGKIGDDKAWDSVESALSDANTDVRAAAVATLASYPGHGDTAALLTDALRDSQVAVRLAGAQAAKLAKLEALKDLLDYRVRKDPEARVQTACLQALAAYPDGATKVLAVLADRKASAAIWKEALNITLDKQYPDAQNVLQKLIEDDTKDKGNLTPQVASALLAYRDTYRALFGVLLMSDKPAARSSALRAIDLGKFQEYEGQVRGMAGKDLDAGVKTQAAALVKQWNPDEKKPEEKKP